ncbi:Imm26 family immunity protein [Streptomyces sp. NPDC001663]|uniref:Imm26 family immunity protein n=1 Tax=Streptomyces sp. NPDC001663 TaxID=3364597 RepID=UPI003677A72E
MTLIRMKGQRRHHRPGDVFTLQLANAEYRFGRIVKTGRSGPEGRFPGGILAYVYDVPSAGEVPELSALAADRLLLPPFFTLNWVWHQGYFRTVAHEELEAAHLLDQHCFYDASTESYVDENDNIIPDRAEPCGWFALSTFQQFQHELDEALAGRPVDVPYARK